ncbi:MAG: SRPBCC domain-containing protein [Terracidiphilus sp.]
MRYHDKERYSPDYSNAPRTLVEFRLEKTAAGTLLTVTESGFENVPAEWRGDAQRGNDGGWTQQMNNIARHVTEKP